MFSFSFIHSFILCCIFILLLSISLVSLSFATNDFKFSKIILLCYGNAIAYSLLLFIMVYARDSIYYTFRWLLSCLYVCTFLNLQHLLLYSFITSFTLQSDKMEWKGEKLYVFFLFRTLNKWLTLGMKFCVRCYFCLYANFNNYDKLKCFILQDAKAAITTKWM